jgi:RHS repeat-associated protein
MITFAILWRSWMKALRIATFTAFLIMTCNLFAYAMDTETGETPEVQFSSVAAKDLKDKAAELGSPVKIYEYLLNSSQYSLYHGSRSGSINSFMGNRGNDVDLASTLISMFRSRGIHARYVVGNVRVSTDKVMNWLGVKNADLAASIMKNQGIQNVILSSDKTTIDFEHVWVESLLSYNNYRGAGPDSSASCTTSNATCRWVSLDPSFKLKQYNPQSIDIYNNVQFDYTSYYNAIKNNDPKFRDKNPLEIYEEQILSYLQTNNPGKTLEDVADPGKILQQNNLILPASLPYEVITSVRRYNSVADHDAVVGTAESKKWNKLVKITVDWSNGSGGIFTGGGTVSLVDASTKRLTLTYELKTTPQGSDRMVTRLGGVDIAVPLTVGSLSINGQQVTTGFPFTINLEMDGAPAATSGGTDNVIKVSYQNCVVGGYYLIATGGETSNWSQVHRAADELLQVNQQYNIINDASGVPYVDTNGNGVIDAGEPRLIDNRAGMDSLTGGILYVAATQYYAKFREQMERADNLDKVKTPIEGFLGVVSSVYDVDYLSYTAFSIMPGGLLIDMKGIQVNGLWRIDQPASFSNKHFELVGHIGSSLEHETWQEITGYDAVSTVRGIQMSLANGAVLANPKKNQTTDTVAAAYSALGFTVGAAPSGFAYTPLSIFTTNPATWTNATQTANFDIFKASVDSSTSSLRLSMATYTYYSSSGLYGWSKCVDDWENNANNFYAANGNVSISPITYCDGTQMSGLILDVLNLMKTRYLNTIIPNNIGQTYFNYFDIVQGFQLSNYVTRANPVSADVHSTQFVQQIRNNLYLADLNSYWHEYLVPSKKTVGDTYRFSVYIDKIYDAPSGNLGSQSYIIANQGVLSNGGYVDGKLVINQSTVPLTTSNVAPSFNNSVFTDKNTIAQTNNDVVKTPSTSDPVSTVTGNNYHDETDFSIKGKGLNFVFTRTYNSAPSSTGLDGPLGFGWTHSYGMRLKSNDYGDCPNCSSGAGIGQRPENGNNKTSSITYTDERGGEHNYLVNETTYGVSSPKGEFDTFQFDTPTSGYHTISYRNGVKYIFQGLSDIKSVPGRTATLYRIEDPYGNSLTFTYTGGNLATINDALNRVINLFYNANNRISSVSDWSGRIWYYVYDTNGNLQSVTNPLNKTVQYTYQPGTHNLYEIILPETRNGLQVKTTFKYYRNGKTFNYSNNLGHTETLDYDLYRKITRVTDPRGFIREYEYDANGLLTKLTEPDKAILLFDNSADGLRYKKSDGLGYSTSYSYRADRALTGVSDTAGQVTLEKDPLNYSVEYDYGIYDQVTRTKDKNGNIRTMSYYAVSNPAIDAVKGKLQSVTLNSLNGYSNVLMQSVTYYPDGNLKQLTEYIDPANPARKRISTYVYQDNGLNLQSVTVAGSGKTVQVTYTYDTLGRKKSQTLWRQTSNDNLTLIPLVTGYEYDSFDRVTKVTDPTGSFIETVYDGNGKVLQVKGNYKKPDNTFDVRTISTKQYDAADRLISDTDIYGKITQYYYDEAGNLIKTVDPIGHIVQYEYDAMNRRTAVVDANGYRTETVYDLAGHPIKNINPIQKFVITEYDQLGHVTKVTDPLSYETKFEYDGNGNVKKVIDANAVAGLQPKNTFNATLYKEYDELNRVKREVDALNGETKYSYDLLGNIASITDAENRTTWFDYNDLGRLMQVRDPLIETPTDKTTTFTYDEAGNVLTVVKRGGAQAIFSYDLLNRITNATYANGSDSLTETTFYDVYGNKQSVSNSDITYTYEYDLKNRPVKKTDSRSGKLLYFTYDGAGNILTKTNYDGSVTEYHYDSANRLVAERNSDYLQVSYQYDGAGRLLNRILSNGAKTSYSWDDGNRLTNLINYSANGTIVDSTAYSRDRGGNITSKTDSTGTTGFTYDALYRLTDANYPGTVNDQSYTYDKVGNRLTKIAAGGTIAYVYNIGNQLKEIHQSTVNGPLLKSYDYDNDGNLITKKDGSGSTLQSSVYDAKGRLKSVTTSGQSRTTQMKYDPYDYRFFKYDSRGNQDYYLEGEHLDGIMSGNQWQAKYMRGVVIDEIVNGYQFDTSGTWTNYTFHHDALQSVLGLSGHDGTVLQAISYGPFGEVIGTAGAVNNNHLNYTGREEDPDSGLMYYRKRTYDRETGRFTSEDPKGFAAGINFYVYVQNNPINANDPYGLYTGTDDATFLLGGAVIGLFGQGLSDVMAGKLSTWQDYAGAAVGGAIGGWSLLYTGPVAAGAIGGATTNLVKQDLKLMTGLQNDLNISSLIADGTIGAITGTIPGVKVPNITSGQGSFNSIFNQITTKFENGTISSVSLPTSIKMFIGRGVDTGMIEAAGAGAAASNVLSEIQSAGTNQQNMYFDFNSSLAAGGYVIYPNKFNLNMTRSVYKK